MSRSARLPIALLALLVGAALSGCLVEPRLDFACRERDGAPGRPYDAAALATLVRVETDGAPLDPALRDAMLAQAAGQVLTPDGAPYERFDGVLRPYFPVREGAELQTWLFTANASRSGEYPQYTHVMLVRHGVLQPPTSELVVAPVRLRDEAAAVARASDEAAPTLAAKPDLVSAAWDPARPSCIVLQYGCWSGDGQECRATAGAAPRPEPTPQSPSPQPSPSAGPPTFVWVDVVRGRVVGVEEPAA